MLLVSYASAQDHMSGRYENVTEPSVRNGRVCLCGTRVDALSMEGVLARAKYAITHGSRLTISVVNVAKVVKMRRDALLKASVESADLIVADGMPLVWLSRGRRRPLPERVAGIDLMYRLFELAQGCGFGVYMLGAAPAVLFQAVAAARRQYPRLRIAGYHHGYFTEQEERSVAQHVREATPDILLLGMSSPKKELFMSRWSSYMAVPVCHGVGGSLDVMAGRTRRAPQWLQCCGMEWSYRLMQEPRRMWKRYLRSNLVFSLFAPVCVMCRQEHPQQKSCPWWRLHSPRT